MVLDKDRPFGYVHRIADFGKKDRGSGSSMISELDKKVISVIQGDLPLHPRPFAVLAEKIGVSEQRLMERIRELQEEGVIRRFGATLRHQEAGYPSNAMIAWKVPEDRIEEIGAACARFREVSHCYQRVPAKDWPYNFYTMVHAGSREGCRRIAERLARATGTDDYLILFSEREFKKTSMAYFLEAHHDGAVGSPAEEGV